VGRRGYWREPDGAALTAKEAYDVWGNEAYPILSGVAHHYHAVITYGELAGEVQKATGVYTSAPFRRWIGKVLRRVVHRAHRQGDPPLTALVVHSTDGKVGEGYKAVLEVSGQPPIDDDLKREYHAASARLDCYRRFGAELPPGGGVPALAPRLHATVARRRPAAAPPPSCPNCFIQLPATGVCDTCGYTATASGPQQAD
jgi:hypothetical protein